MKIRDIKSIQLILTKEEATWLLNIMQNPLHNQTPEEERDIDKSYRYELFSGLHNILYKNGA